MAKPRALDPKWQAFIAGLALVAQKVWGIKIEENTGEPWGWYWADSDGNSILPTAHIGTPSQKAIDSMAEKGWKPVYLYRKEDL